MTSWDFFILVAAVFIGLKRSMGERQRYAAVCVVVVVAVSYAALRQHAY